MGLLNSMSRFGAHLGDVKGLSQLLWALIQVLALCGHPIQDSSFVHEH